MKRHSLPLLSVVALAASAVADEKPAPSPELEVLAHFIGTWDLEVTLTNPGQEPVEAKSVSYRRWSKGGSALIFEEPEGGQEVVLALTPNPAKKDYTGVIMIGAGAGTISATWDAASKTMRFSIEYTNGFTYKGKHQFIRDGYAEAAGQVMDGEGNVVHEIAWKQTRSGKK